jgi:hypothetical protein
MIDIPILYVGKLPTKNDDFVCAFHPNKNYGHIPLYSHDYVYKLKQEIESLKLKIND